MIGWLIKRGAKRKQGGIIRRINIAFAGAIGFDIQLMRGQRQRRERYALLLEIDVEIGLAGGASHHTDTHAGQLQRRDDAAIGADHEALPVKKADPDEFKAELDLTLHGPRRVARQNIDLARLQGGETIIGIQRHVAHRLAPAQGGSRNGATDIGLETLPFAGGVACRKAGQPFIDAAQDMAARFRRLQRWAHESRG